jgi:hypothetical protein
VRSGVSVVSYVPGLPARQECVPMAAHATLALPPVASDITAHIYVGLKFIQFINLPVIWCAEYRSVVKASTCNTPPPQNRTSGSFSPWPQSQIWLLPTPCRRQVEVSPAYSILNALPQPRQAHPWALIACVGVTSAARTTPSCAPPPARPGSQHHSHSTPPPPRLQFHRFHQG